LKAITSKYSLGGGIPLVSMAVSGILSLPGVVCIKVEAVYN
jgi:hypothetical protein